MALPLHPAASLWRWWARIGMQLLVLCLLAGCGRRGRAYVWQQEGYRADPAFVMPAQVDECSGAVAWTDSSCLTHNDDGPPALYEVSYRGHLLATYLLAPPARNQDWEDLAITRDSASGAPIVYAADVGNNLNRRDNLALYQCRLPAQPPQAGGRPVEIAGIPAQRIGLRYIDQRALPPPPERQNYDCEAVFAWEGSLWLLSKNRGRKTVRVYRLPKAAGPEPDERVAQVADSARLFHTITGASVSPSGRRLALVGYGMVYLYDLVAGQGPLRHLRASLAFARSGQVEAIWWVDERRFYVANEQGQAWLFKPLP